MKYCLVAKGLLSLTKPPNKNHYLTLHKCQTRADQNRCGALLEFPLRTAMHGRSRISSATSVCNN